jgi:hypothetical protein
VELQGLRAFRSARLLALLILPTVAVLALVAPATASASPSGYVVSGQPYPVSAPPGTPTLVSNLDKPPAGYKLTAKQVLAIASKNTLVIKVRKEKPDLVAYEYTRGPGIWQVSWFTPPGKAQQLEEIQVYIDDATGQVTQAWSGYQVAWTMARGYTGAFGRRVNSLYIWIPLCVLFLLPFIPWRTRRPTLLHLDLLMLLGFSLSLAWFNHANLGLSVPMVYPFMIYLLIRMLLLAFGIGRPKAPLPMLVPASWLAIGIVFLVGFRIGLNVTDSNVIDVGYAGVIGAHQIVDGNKLYGEPAPNEQSSPPCSNAAPTKDLWPCSNSAGDTYGPINYYAYLPALAIFGWSGAWDNLPAAHAAAIAFDLLTMLGLFLLGRAIRGPTLGTVMAYMWAAFPFTLYTLNSNSNDSLVAMLIVYALLAARSAPGRGILGAFAGLTKFAPLALGPLLLRGVGDPPTRRQVLLYVVAFGLALIVPVLPVILSHDWNWFWTDTIKYQSGRPAPFSIWGLWGDTFGGKQTSLIVPQRIVQGLTVALALAVMVFPRGKRSMAQVAALGAAIIIGVEMCLTYWFYLYIPWFFALVVIALAAFHPPAPGEEPDRDSAVPAAAAVALSA